MDRISRAIRRAGNGRPDSNNDAVSVLNFNKENYVPVPKNALIRNKIITGPGSNHPVADYYRLLRTTILRTMASNDWNVIGITGPSAAAGKTLTAANLAISIATIPDYSVLLIDGDMRKNATSKLFGITPQFGLEDVLSGNASLEEAIVCPGISNLGLLLSNFHESASDLLMSRALPRFIRQLKESDEQLITIFDLPPYNMGDDTVAIASHLDAALLVVDAGKTTKEQLQSSTNFLKDVNILGYVLNNAPERECGYQQPGKY